MQNLRNYNGNKQTEFPQLNTPQIYALMDCMSICAACAKKCMDEGHKKTAAFCAECTDICALAIKAVSCQSEFHAQLLELCAQVCRRCADECQRMQTQYCKECGQICKQCAEACSTSYSMR